MRVRTGGWLASALRRPTASQRSAHGDRGTAEQAVRRLARLEQVVAVPLSTQPLEALLPEMAARLGRALDADFAAVLLVEDDTLRLRATAGSLGSGDIGAVVPFGAGLVGRVVQDGVTRTLADLDDVPPALPTLRRDIPAAAAAALTVGDAVIGVIAIGSRTPNSYDDGELPVLEFAAERLAGAVEAARVGDVGRRAALGAEHAQRHLSMLGDASRLLMRSVDDFEGPLVEIMDNVLGRFATLAAVYVADGEPERSPHLRPLAARLYGARRDVQLPSTALHALGDAMADGHSRLVIFDGAHEEDHRDRPLMEALTPLGLRSCIVAPIQVRGLSFGVLLFGTGPDIRGFRPSDRLAVDELSQRIALSAEASLLYREARSNAAATAAHLLRLRGLLDVWFDVAAARDRASILQAAANGAARLLTPAYVTVSDHGEQYVAPPTSRTSRLAPAFLAMLESHDVLVSSEQITATELDEADCESLGARWLAAPVTTGGEDTSWIVVSSNDGGFTGEDESLLVLLSQMVVAMLVNAELYQESRASAARLAALFEASPPGMVTLTAGLDASNWNPSAAELLGWPTRPGGSPAAMPAQIASCVQELSLSPSVGQQECELTRDGTTRTLVLMLSAGAAHGVTSERILVITDDTERRQLALQVQQTQRLDAVGRLSGGMAHDFNNLLTVILGYADALLRRMDDDDPNRERVEAIHRAGTRGAELTRQLLTISRQQATNPVVLRPAQVVDEISTMVRQILGEAVELRREPGGEQLKVLIDRPQLEQILLNLASNARDAMPEGGLLTIAVTERPSKPTGSSPGQDHPGPWVIVSATDTGTGMDPDTLAHCLEPLFTTKQLGLGTGLGLATALGIAAQHHGDLRVASTPGLGTTVTLELPAATGDVVPTEEAALPSPRHDPEVGAGTILLVDDDPDVRTMVESTLRERGYRVVAAASGAQALRMMVDQTDPIDLLLTDVAMPGMSGADLALIVQAADDVPVLFISGYAEQLGPDSARGRLLAKPFTPDDLMASVVSAIQAGSGDHGSKR